MRTSLLLLTALALVPACALDRRALTPSRDGGGSFDAFDEAGEEDDADVDASCISPSAETCNERDDDCDGRIDETFDLEMDLSNCGRCGTVCRGGDHAAPRCDTGTCRLSCDTGWGDCDDLGADGCEASLSDARTCGTCTNDCTLTATPLCMDDGSGATCVTSCTAPTELCGASCVDTTSSVAHCGACGVPCADRPGSSASCASRTCTYACDDGLGDCDTDRANGCETSTRTTTDCGDCGVPCAFAGAAASCTTGTCTFETCTAGLGDCDTDLSNGCESSLDTVTNCSACGMPCTLARASASCPAGVCTLGACSPGFGDCDGVAASGCETDLSLAASCGVCGRVCASAERCVAGSCIDPRVIVEVGTGELSSCARIADGRVYCWGDNASGQLGLGTTVDSLVPVQVPGITDAIDLGVGLRHACVVRMGGAVSCWGENGRGQAGDDTTNSDRLSPIVVMGISDARFVSGGDEHTCAVRTTGAVSCWGRNDHLQLGTGGGDRGIPMDVMTLTDAIEIDAGGGFNCVVRRAGQVACWGEDGVRQLGDGLTAERSAPFTIPGISDALHVSCGSDFACLVHGTGVVDCWGANDQGQLGDGLTMASRGAIEPVMGVPPAGAVDVTCGSDHACLRTGGGAVSCWGDNAAGQLGDMSFTDRTMPVPAVGLAAIVSASADDQHTCAASGAGVWCWGSNIQGELGIGSTASSNVPMMSAGLPPPP